LQIWILSSTNKHACQKQLDWVYNGMQ
jgi:hypothetical protein